MKTSQLRQKKFRAVIFDLDDTLVPSRAAYRFAMEKVGVKESDETFQLARRLTKAQLPTLAPVARSRYLYFKKYLELNGQYSPQKHFALAESYEENVVAFLTAFWQQQSRSKLMTELLRTDLRIAILTNETLKLQTRKLCSFWPAELPLTLLCSEEIGCEKPNPQIFAACLKQLSLSADEVFYVGDSVPMDIEPCQKLGLMPIHTIEFANSAELTKTATDCLQITKLDQLREWFSGAL